jgi:DNA-binding transcriptional ArsR family regulator
LTGTDEYDEIFAALKHPVRRQILLFLEQNGEVSFTALQKAVGKDDTGLLSYHLKELAPLVEQSERGKYRLSEIGKAAVALFMKVEDERNLTSKVVSREFERWIGKIVFLAFIVGITLIAPLSVDIYLSVQTLNGSSLSLEQVVGMFLTGFLGMLSGVVLFVFYDRHYFSRRVRTNVVHSEGFATALSLLSILTVYVVVSFQASTLTMGSSVTYSNLTWLLGVARTVAFLSITPLLTYAIVRILNRN